jgi:two-component system, OmpR family, response regulator
VAAQPDPDFEKIAVITVGYDRAAYYVVSTDIRPGMAPNLYITSGSLKGVILDNAGKEVRTFSLQDPAIAFSDPPMGTGSSGGTGRGSPLIVTIPYLTTEKTFQLYDLQSGALLATADLSTPFATFCTDYPSDPDCLSSSGGVASAAPAPAPAHRWMYALTLLIAAVVIASGIATTAIVLSRKPRPSHPSRPPAVMVVDDNPDITDLLRTLLTLKGYTAFIAAGGQECLDLLKNQVPDVILLDISMEPMDGWTTLERIRADPATKFIPVLMLTAKPLMPEDVRKYHVCIDDYITKPFSNAEIYAAVGHVIERKKKIMESLARVRKAGVTQEAFCELQKLSKRVDVDKKLLDLLQRRYEGRVAEPPDTGDEFSSTVEQLISSTRISEARLEEIRRQITMACRDKGYPVPEL